MNEARQRLLKILSMTRKEDSDAASVIKESKRSLNTDDAEADLIALLLLWGSQHQHAADQCSGLRRGC
jgi:hypothetical protein